MTIYIILYIVLLALWTVFCLYKPSKIKINTALVIGSAVLLFVAGFRYSSGHDYYNYARSFLRIHNGEQSSFDSEPGFIFVRDLIIEFTDNFAVFHFIIALIFAGFLLYFLWNKSSAPMIGLIAYYSWGFYFNSYNFLRQIFAAFIFIFAIKYAKEKNIVRFVLFTLLASCFHLSALFLLFFYIPFQFKLNNIHLALYCIISTASFVFSKNIFQLVAHYIYPSYYVSTTGSNSALEVFGGLSPVYFFLFTLIFIIAYVNRKEIYAQNEYGKILIQCAFFLSFFELIGIKHAIVSRMSIYFGLISVLILIPQIYSIFFDAFSKYRIIKSDSSLTTGEASVITRTFIRYSISCAVLTLGGIAFFGYSLYNNYNSVVPHYWIWNYLN